VNKENAAHISAEITDILCFLASFLPDSFPLTFFLGHFFFPAAGIESVALAQSSIAVWTSKLESRFQLQNSNRAITEIYVIYREYEGFADTAP
jgi:hypothetical protein